MDPLIVRHGKNKTEKGNKIEKADKIHESSN
jgi:hypothetical protein